MELVITKKTRTRQILPFLTTANIKELIKNVDAVQLDVPITEMSIEKFDSVLSSPEAFLLELATSNKRALVFLGKCKDFLDSIEGFTRFVKQYEMKKTQEENQASAGIAFPSFGDSMIATLVSFYHLQSVESAANMPLKAWMLAFQHNASNALFNQRYSQLMKKNSKAKK